MKRHTVDKNQTNANSNILPVYMRFTVYAVDLAWPCSIQTEIIKQSIQRSYAIGVIYVAMTFLVPGDYFWEAVSQELHSDGPDV